MIDVIIWGTVFLYFTSTRDRAKRCLSLLHNSISALLDSLIGLQDDVNWLASAVGWPCLTTFFLIKVPQWAKESPFLVMNTNPYFANF